MSSKRLSRRDFLRLSGIFTASLIVSSCKQTATDMPEATEMPEATMKPDDVEACTNRYLPPTD